MFFLALDVSRVCRVVVEYVGTTYRFHLGERAQVNDTKHWSDTVIANDALHRIFESIFRTKAVEHANDLGLHACNATMRGVLKNANHHERILVEGLRFALRLPVAESDARQLKDVTR